MTAKPAAGSEAFPPHRLVLGLRVDATDYAAAARLITDWAASDHHGLVCAANVHMCMLAHDDRDFRELLNQALLVVPDGMPLVWMLRRLGLPQQQRVYGPDLVWHVLARAADDGLAVCQLGGTTEMLDRLAAVYLMRLPHLRIAYAHAPPFRDLSPAEDAAVVGGIAEAGVRILLVGLGCPKQERWMHAHRDQIAAVMLGVGAAFPFHAGLVRQAPPWLQRLGLEWLFRLLAEPRRLWWRYASSNPRFILHALAQLCARRRRGGPHATAG